jgi:tetratricopeptide (TPR) repeat protein
MIEVLDFYAQGLDRRKDVVELHKKAKEELRIWTTRANNAKPGTPAATDAPRKRDLWAKAKHVFSTEEGRKKYDAELTAWQSSVDAQRAKGQADQLAKDFASATETVLELVARAWEELDKGNLRAASQVASKAMRLDASQWEAYLIAGIASFRQNDFDESMFCMRHAARLNPDNAQVFSGLGELYERLDNWQEAFKHYSKAIALAPDDVDYKIRAGFVCVKAEVPDQGIELLRRALEIDPDHQGAKWALGVALAESAQLGWTEVPEGHPRVPPGWYAMSRNQALQAIRKLHEANALGVEDQELSTHLAKVKQDVDRNIKRHFDGSWVLFGVILLVAFFLKSNIGVSLMVAVLAAVYYGAYLPPQYTINARILAGDSKLKTGFMNWLENIQNPWIKLIINLILIELIPIFTLYSAIKNWTGENAPLGKDLKDIGSTSESTVPSFANITIEANASVIKKTDSVLANFSPQSIFTSSKLRSLAISIINSLPLLRLKSLANSIEKSFSSLKLKSLAISIPKSFPSFKLKSLAISIPKSFPSLRLKSLVIFMVVASLTVLFGYYLIAMSNNLHRPESMITANKKLLNLLQNEPEKINFQIIDDLLSSGANPNLNDTYNAQTVLAWAIGNNKVDIARLLIKNGADVNSVSSSDPSRPAIVGVRSVEMLELLLHQEWSKH